VKQSTEDIFHSIFYKYYPGLLFYATRLLGDEDAEDVVQDVLVELWCRKDLMEAGNSLQAYLYRMVYNKSVNVMKHRGVQDKYCAAQEEINRKRIDFYQPDRTDIITRLENAELRKELYLSINDLPDQCRKIFKLSYIHNMKNKAIAELLDISVRTVEAHMYKALKILREKLHHLATVLLIYLGI